MKVFIHKAEEEALRVDENATERYRRGKQNPDSVVFAMVMPKNKKGRSETVSTDLFNKHNTNKLIQAYPRLY